MATPIKYNDTQEGCNPISSNCVQWQGPDIPCINLCSGDTVSDVVAKLASELCTLIDELKISAYDLSCFDPMCPTPTSFQAMIQLLIDKVCALYNLDPTTSTAGCPDCEVTVAPCLVTLDNLGNSITTLLLKDYVILIGNKICTILTDIASQGASIADLEARVTLVEACCSNTPGVPTVATSCLQPSASNIPVTAFASALESAFCALQAVTGTVAALQASFNQQCSGLNSAAPLDPAQVASPMSSIPGWVASPTTVADTLTNMWLTICDMRAGLVDLIAQVNTCCAVSCSDIIGELNNVVYDNGKGISFNFPISFPAGWGFGANATWTVTGCRPGTPAATGTIALATTGNEIDLATAFPLVFNSLFWNLTIIAYYTDESSTCTQVLQEVGITGPLTCPAVGLAAGTAYELTASFSASILATYQVGYRIDLIRVSDNTLAGTYSWPAGSTGSLSHTWSGLDDTQSYTAQIYLSQGTCAQSAPCNTSSSVTPASPPPPAP